MCSRLPIVELRRKEVVDMAAVLKKVSCDPMCGFMIQSHDETEILETVKRHVKNAHKMETTDEEVRGKMEDVAS